MFLNKCVEKAGWAAFAVVVVGTTACSTAKVRIMPGEDGVVRALVRDIERDNAETAAIDSANDHCAKQKKSAVFIKTDTKYTGDMDESTRNTVRKASKTAQILGRPGMRGQDSPIGVAGTIGTSMTSDRDYEVDVLFRCQ